MTPVPFSNERLPRTLGLWSASALVVGITIGSGIFRTPAGVAQRVPHPEAMLLLWVLGGAITLCGALSIGELAAAMPETGGLYAFLREGWGRLAAFLFGWAELVLIRANALGGIAIVFGDYFLRSLGIDPGDHTFAARVLSAGAIAFAAAVNVRGARLGALVVGTATWAKYAALALLAGAAFLLGGNHGASMTNLTTGTGAPLALSSMGLALVSILWAYDGWADLSFAGGEVRNPKVTLPRAIILGTVAIIVIYLLTNLAYLYVNPIDVVAKSQLIAADTMAALFGRAGVVVVSILVMISAFSSLNGSMLVGPRIFFAMADDGMLFKAIGRVHPTYQTPYVSIIFAALLGMALVMSRSFEAITNTFVLAIWPFYALSIAAIFRLRRLRPDLPRPYRAVGYPVVPAIFVLAVVAFVVNALVQEPVPTALTFAMILAGVPVYFLVDRRRGQPALK